VQTTSVIERNSPNVSILPLPFMSVYVTTQVMVVRFRTMVRVTVDAAAGIAVSSARARTEPTMVGSFFVLSSVGEIKGGTMEATVEVFGARPSWCTTP